MAKSSPEKLAAALRANLLRRKKGSTGLKGPENGRAAKRAPDMAAKPAEPTAPAPAKGPDKPAKNSA
jgi:hypothetical protein